jgi:hypothetical protein
MFAIAPATKLRGGPFGLIGQIFYKASSAVRMAIVA